MKFKIIFFGLISLVLAFYFGAIWAESVPKKFIRVYKTYEFRTEKESKNSRMIHGIVKEMELPVPYFGVTISAYRDEPFRISIWTKIKNYLPKINFYSVYKSEIDLDDWENYCPLKHLKN